jgi:Uma2 family endonuclease
MNATVARPQPGYRLSRAELRLRWEQLADDPMVAAIPCKVELNEKGAIEVSPPTTRHGTIQAFVARELARQRPEGTVITECPVETDIGMRVPDVIWASPGFMDRHRDEAQFQHAPDLCCEVLSPRNTQAEMSEKVAAYLAAGAQEVWVVGDDGAPEIHTSSGQVAASALGFALPQPPATT